MPTTTTDGTAGGGGGGGRSEEVVDFQAMPKIELHAHLTGSITRRCLHDIWRAKKSAGKAGDLEDPLVVMPEGRNDHDLTSFFPLFSSYIYRLVNDLDSIRKSTKQVVHDFAADGVVYLELRTTPRAVPAAGLDKEGYVRAVLEAIEEAEEEAESERAGPNGRGGMGIRVRLILSVDRRNTVDEAWEVLELAQKFMAPGLSTSRESRKTTRTGTTTTPAVTAATTKRSGSGKSGVVGIDLCGDVAQGRVDTFTPVMCAARDSGLQLTIHFAESARTGTDEELETILSWRPKRLGHVIHVSERVKQMIISQSRGRRYDTKESRGGGGKEGEGNDIDDNKNNDGPIGLELCLSSNVQLKMIVGGFDVHHFGEWWKVQDGPIIMPCTDDVGVFESTLSNEWRLVQQYFGLTRQDIALLGRKSIDVIFGGEEEKARLREILW